MPLRSGFGLMVPGSALACLLFASCGGGGSDDVVAPAPRFIVAVHGSARFERHTDIPGVCPRKLEFSVFLEDGGHGWVSLEHPAFGSRVFDATWTLSGPSYDVIVPDARVRAQFQEDPYYYANVGWETLKLTVLDEDQDGTGESGTATATLACDWEVVLSPRQERYESTFDLEGDHDPAVLVLRNGGGTEPLHPGNSKLFVDASSSLLAESIPGGATLLVNGQPVAADIIPGSSAGPFAGGLVINPELALPFGAEISFAPGSIVDAFGAPATWDGSVYRTVADPGPITDNLSFEQSGGWIGLHTTTYEPHPPDGRTVAKVGYSYPQGDALIGYFDVPDDAKRLTVAVAVDDYLTSCGYASSDFWLEAPGGSYNLFPDVPGDLGCRDFPDGCSIPWSRKSVNLKPLRGQRVLLVATPARYNECRFGETDTLLIDDIRITYETPSTTSTTQSIGDQCFNDNDCLDEYPAVHCGGSGGYQCVECMEDEHCDDGFRCAGFACVPE